MAFNIDVFRSNFLAEGARAALFDVLMTFPEIVSGTADGNKLANDLTFKARMTTLPGDTIPSISVNYFGREIKVAGIHTFPDHTLTIINDEDFVLRNRFERWMSVINSHVNNLRAADAGTWLQYNAPRFEIRQYNKIGGISKRYFLIGAFPTDISAIDVDWGSDTIEEFSVTFAYQWWESDTSDSSSGVGVQGPVIPGAGTGLLG